jgi:energy-converting hydrogenase Eha subunit A
MGSFSDALFLVGLRLFDVPWYQRHLVAILFGVGAIVSAIFGEPINTRSNEPWTSKPFFRTSMLVLGIGMIAISLWGLWLKTP